MILSAPPPGLLILTDPAVECLILRRAPASAVILRGMSVILSRPCPLPHRNELLPRDVEGELVRRPEAVGRRVALREVDGRPPAEVGGVGVEQPSLRRPPCLRGGGGSCSAAAAAFF